MTPDEYAAAVRALVEEARLYEPDLSRPWWADDLGWLAHAVAQGVHSRVLQEGEHVVFLRREARRFLRTSLAECRCLAVHLETSLPALAACGFSMPPGDVDRALALATDTNEGLVVGVRERIYYRSASRWRRAAVLDWAKVQALGSTPRRGDPRSK
ncbi:MAG: hypothetical protein KC583_07270 [Myxococcales bacterium]|nr:hypothetical protein [Myxococcales bacterium]